MAPDASGTERFAHSIESRASWVAAGVTLAILSVSYGAPLLVAVGLKPIAADLGASRSVLALAGSLTWMGSGIGGVLMGWVADRTGVRVTAAFGAVMMALGLALSSTGHIWALYVGHFLLIGVFGNGAIYAPLVIHVSRWFDRRRGTALALISSGQYVAGVVWPAVFERGFDRFGWRATMLAFAGVVLLAIVPVATLCLRPAPDAPRPGRSGRARHAPAVLGLRPNVLQATLCFAAFLCCVPMAMPASHIVAFCSDLGIAPEQGAAMLSVLLGCAFFSRQFWGWLADRVGGLAAVMVGSACQTLAIWAFLLTQDEIGLFAVAGAFGFGFSGIIPAYVLAIREFFPSAEASWRVPMLLLWGMGGMAFGSWLAGALYDHFGFYAPAFATGGAFNVANLVVIGLLLLRQGPTRGVQLA